MARLNSKWLDVVLGGGIGIAASWYVHFILATGKWEFTSRFGEHELSTPDREPFFYWLWVAIWAGIGLFCFWRAARALIDIVRVHWMDQRIDRD